MGLVALFLELGASTLLMAGSLTMGAANKVRRRKKPVCVVTDDGYYYAGVLISPREIRNPEYGNVRAYLRNHADQLRLTKRQRQAVGA